MLALLVIPAFAGCSGEPDRPAKTYETRGIVRQLPVTGAPGGEIFIHHEEIPDFESIDGKVTGMQAMAMGFPVDDPRMVESLSVGDKVAFALRVDWDGSPPLQVTELEKLPAETRLSFEVDGAGTDSSRDGAPSDHHGHGPAGTGHGHGDVGGSSGDAGDPGGSGDAGEPG